MDGLISMYIGLGGGWQLADGLIRVWVKVVGVGG